MTIQEMHYDFKKKLNKIDSEQNKNLIIPEIDWVLNEAQNLYIKMIAEPRVANISYFENKQRTIDDIRTIVKENQSVKIQNDIITLPSDYMFHIRSYAYISKGECKNKKATLYIRKHEEEFQESPFDRSSFEWRTLNGVFNERGIKFYTEENFTVDKVEMSYIRKPILIHNAKDFRTGEYKLPSGQLLSGSVNCELPEHTHSEIVDLAVLLTSGEMMSDYKANTAKVNLNLK